jgi:hypothetical protein
VLVAHVTALERLAAAVTALRAVDDRGVLALAGLTALRLGTFSVVRARHAHGCGNEISIARLLEENGRPDLAEAYRTGQVADQPETPPAPVEDEGEKFLRELRDANNRGRVSIPGLLDE